MGVEIEGNLGSNDYKARQVAQSLRTKDAIIKALEISLEETKRAAAEREAKLLAKNETMLRSLKNYKCRAAKPREVKPVAETKADSPGGTLKEWFKSVAS
jgi:hypothetical protein